MREMHARSLYPLSWQCKGRFATNEPSEEVHHIHLAMNYASA
jgi:hypothetical protein